MRVSQAVFGVFHHFELAHQLRRYNYLDTVYSTYPWRRLQRERLPHEYVQTFPWIHGGLAALARFGLYPSPWTEGSGLVERTRLRQMDDAANRSIQHKA